MKKLILPFLTLFTLLLFNFDHAQTTGGKISGSVLDETKKPLYGATLAFTYSFGKTTNVPQKRETGGADSEQGRAH